MEGTELDMLLDDLETRVERLRSLYEQYFMGIEKIPPHIVQKDVDRRLYALRREQIRNTARRFKLQTIIQRYNTFQQYWMRIMREIENGTYRRHVLRAERTVGVTDLLTAAERKRQALPEPEGRATNPPLAGDAPLDAAEVREAPPSPSPQTTSTGSSVPESVDKISPKAVRAEIEHQLGLLLDDDLEELDTRGLGDLGQELDDPLLSSMPPPMRRKISAKPIARRSARPGGNYASPVPKPNSHAPSTRAPVSATQARLPSQSVRPSRTLDNTNAQRGPGGGLKLPASSAVAGRGLPPPARPTAPRGAPIKAPSSPITAVAVRQAPSPERGVPKKPASSHPQSSSSTKSTETAQWSQLGSRGSATVDPRSPAAVTQAPEPTRTAGSVGGAQEDRRPAAGPPAAPAPTRVEHTGPIKASVSRPESDALDRTRVEKLAENLRSARLQTNETAPVSVDALAKKLQSTTEQLRQKHHGKQIDFEVIIRDGKAILKPIVR